MSNVNYQNLTHRNLGLAKRFVQRTEAPVPQLAPVEPAGRFMFSYVESSLPHGIRTGRGPRA